MSITHEYLVVYDYSMGGVWAIVVAPPPLSVRNTIPELTVDADRPDWMDNEYFENIRLTSKFTLDDESSYPDWIRTLIAERS